jgi:hypothetical protein
MYLIVVHIFGLMYLSKKTPQKTRKEPLASQSLLEALNLITLG